MSAPHKPSVTLVVHGHFYQPPRDNPWTDEVPAEPSAQPFHDWNARIHAECYRANAYARIYGADNRIHEMANNYGHISFNFGPTLARWIERNDPRTLARIVAGDRLQQKKLGHGGAMAQVWGHPIVPLLSPADRRTQILWGLQDFRRHFGREAEGIWLPETAADPPSLQALIDAGLKFTILAPEQIAAVRAPGKATFTEVNRDSIDCGRLYKWVAPSGKSLAVAVFDGPMSREIAFGDAARDAATFLQKVKASAERSAVKGRRLVLAASDGELYGHHKKFSDLTLAYATSVDAPKVGVQVTNLAAFLAEDPPTWELELAKGPNGEGTAWSCAHGVGRWRRHCGCAMRSPAETGWSQAWRGPLRDGLDLLRDRGVAFFEDLGSDLFVDPWGARDAYGAVIDDPPAARGQLLQTFGRSALRGGEASAVRRAHLLMEMQRAALLMYASCGWFFDDVAGLESALILRQAAYAADLWRALGGTPPEDELLDVLAKARSNEPRPGLRTGADVYRRMTRARVTPVIAVAQAAFHTLVQTGAPRPDTAVPGFQVNMPAPAGALRGQARVTERRSGEETQLEFSASYDGSMKFECLAGGQRLQLDDLDDSAARPLRFAALHRVAAHPPSLATCRTALTLAAALGPPVDAEKETLQELFGRLLLGLLQAHAPQLDNDVLEVAAALVDRSELGVHPDVAHLAEDLIWDTLVHLREHRKQPTPLLLALAVRLKIAPEDPRLRGD
jgi:alpha-amylase/alpha-mannosidase (GH57 family)